MTPTWAPSWAPRAASAERAVTARHVRRLAGLLPGTRIGRTRWPRPSPAPPWRWHYWWQAHLLDCLLDAELRAPAPHRAATVAALVRGVRLHNLGRWTNGYYDDIAWFGLAVQRAGGLVGAGPRAFAAITARLRSGCTPDGGGGIWWRRGDDFKNAPANGPAAILLARAGMLGSAASITDWMADRLLDPVTGLVRDGVRLAPDGSVRAVEGTVYSYCQGVYLGACVELAHRDRDPRWSARATAVLEAVATRLVGPDGVVPGDGDGGGDGGLFNGILTRYLADAALRRPELAPTASRLVLASADAAWAGRAETEHGPVFAPDWRRPARSPVRDCPEADLSVQLSGWMLMEAAAAIERAW